MPGVAAREVRRPCHRLVYQTEKTLGEHGASLDATTKGGIEAALVDAKKAVESDDAAVIKAAADALARASHKLAEAMYSKATRSDGGDSASDGGGSATDNGAAGGGEKPKDDVVEAEFEEVKE
jgi:molecular chaperone DnaK